MKRIIKDRRIVGDDCRHLGADDVLQTGATITLPLERWLAERPALENHAGRVGVRLQGTDDLSTIVPYLAELELIVLEFPKFTDGRCYSHARLLRDRYGYRRELRAIGDVLRDQLYFMARCGINAFELSKDSDLDAALQGFNEFSVQYQAAADHRRPVYHIRHSSKNSALGG